MKKGKKHLQMSVRLVRMALCLMIAAAICAQSGLEGGADMAKAEEKKEPIKYVTLMYTNKRYEEIEAYLPEMYYLHGRNDPNSDRMYAFGVPGPMLLTASPEEMAEQINACFDMAERYDIPVYFQMDDCTNYTTYFGKGAEIKFYEHPEMCEWIAFPEEGEEYGGQNKYGMLPRFWFNWGTWMASPAFPNFASPEFQSWMLDNLHKGVIEPLTARYNKLKEEGKGYLFAGIGVGWETHIPDYSPTNTFLVVTKDDLPVDAITGGKMQEWELAQYGYGALTSLGYNQERLEKEAAENNTTTTKLMQEILYGVIHDYSELICKQFFDAGIEREKIFTHMVSASSYTKNPNTFTPPIWCAVNDYSIPGYTMSPVTCRYDLEYMKKMIRRADPDMPYFANAEGYAAGVNDEADATAYFNELFDAGAINVTCFGYADPPTRYFTFKRTKDFGYNIALEKWLNHQ